MPLPLQRRGRGTCSDEFRSWKLVSAVSASGPVLKPTFIMNSADAVRALTLAPGLNSDQVAVLLSPYMTPKTAAFLDSSSFASAAGDDIEVVISKDATVVSRAPDPAPITDSGGVSGSPTTSAWQIDAYGIRVLNTLTWAVQPGGVAAVTGVSW